MSSPAWPASWSSFSLARLPAVQPHPTKKRARGGVCSSVFSMQFDVIILGAGAAGLFATRRRPARPPRAAARPCRGGGEEILTLRRRPLQLYQQRLPARPLLLGRPDPPNRRSPATPSTTSSPWSATPASPSTTRRLASSSATRLRPSAPAPAMPLAEAAAAHVDLRLAHRITGVTRAERFRLETDRGAFPGPDAGPGDPAACPSRIRLPSLGFPLKEGQLPRCPKLHCLGRERGQETVSPTFGRGSANEAGLAVVDSTSIR